MPSNRAMRSTESCEAQGHVARRAKSRFAARNEWLRVRRYGTELLHEIWRLKQASQDLSTDIYLCVPDSCAAFGYVDDMGCGCGGGGRGRNVDDSFCRQYRYVDKRSRLCTNARDTKDDLEILASPALVHHDEDDDENLWGRGVVMGGRGSCLVAVGRSAEVVCRVWRGLREGIEGGD